MGLGALHADVQNLAPVQQMDKDRSSLLPLYLLNHTEDSLLVSSLAAETYTSWKPVVFLT